MKKLLTALILAAFVCMPAADIFIQSSRAEAGYALFTKRKAEIDAQLEAARLRGDKEAIERLKKEKERLEQAEREATGDTPKYNGIG